MSGGSFDYTYSRVEYFADELEYRLEHNDSEERDEYGDTKGAGYSPVVVAELRQIVVEARRVARLMKAAEWLYSGDDSEGSFLADVRQMRREEP